MVNDRVKNIAHIGAKVVLSLMLLTPILGVAGVFPEPTRDMYNSDAAFDFIQVLMQEAGYIQYIMALVFVGSVVLLWTRREALAAVLLAPITVNIVGFHLFLDGGLFTSGAIMGNLLLVLNLYLLWRNKDRYDALVQGH